MRIANDRNSVINGTFTIKPVTDFSVFTGFSCLGSSETDRDLEDFIRNDAERHSLDRIAVTYALFQNDIPEPLGFATLQNDAILVAKENSSSEDFEFISQYPYKWFPAVKIGRLGIELKYQRQKLGSVFLGMLIFLMLSENRTGCRFLTVDARRNKKDNIDVTPFYKVNGFRPLPFREKTSSYIPMYLDICKQ